MGIEENKGNSCERKSHERRTRTVAGVSLPVDIPQNFFVGIGILVAGYILKRTYDIAWETKFFPCFRQ